MHAKTQEGQTSNSSHTRVPMEPTVQQTVNGGEGGVVTIEIDDEEEDLQDLIIVEEENEAMEVDTQPMHTAKKLPTFVLP